MAFGIVAAAILRNILIGFQQGLSQQLLRMTISEPREAVINILNLGPKQYKVEKLAEERCDAVYDTSKEILLSIPTTASIDIFNSLIGTITKTEYMKLENSFVNIQPTKIGYRRQSPLPSHSKSLFVELMESISLIGTSR